MPTFKYTALTGVWSNGGPFRELSSVETMNALRVLPEFQGTIDIGLRNISSLSQAKTDLMVAK